MRAVHVVVPNDIDDPATPSGGNVYDRRLCDGLTAAGRAVHEYPVRGAWPRPAPAERAELARVLGTMRDDTVVLIDGLIASAVPDVLVPEARRLRLVVLVHAPLDDDTEARALAAATAVIATSEWSRHRLLDRYALAPARVHVATPGVDPAPVGTGSATGSALLCVAAVTPVKGYDVLVDALAKVADLPWRCTCVGSLDRDPAFTDRLRRRIDGYALADRVPLTGPRTGDRLDATYAAADLLVLPSRSETYGMVVTEALARGIPVLATGVNGVPESLGHAPDGSRPGILVEPGEPAALAGALRDWLGDDGLRARLRRSALARRTTLAGWPATAERAARVLDEVAAA